MNLVFFSKISLVLFAFSAQAELAKTPLPSESVVPGIIGGVFQNAFKWVALDDLDKGTLVFFGPQMIPILKFSNVGKYIDFRIEKSLLNVPLLEIDFERCYSKNNQTYKAVVAELFEIHGDKLQRIYSYTKQLFYTVKVKGRSKQVIFKGMLQANKNHKTTVQYIIQTNQAIPSLKEHYFIDQFIIDESEPLRSFKYQYTFAGEEVLDHPPIDINLLGGNSDYLLLNNCKMK